MLRQLFSPDTDVGGAGLVLQRENNMVACRAPGGTYLLPTWLSTYVRIANTTEVRQAVLQTKLAKPRFVCNRNELPLGPRWAYSVTTWLECITLSRATEGISPSPVGLIIAFPALSKDLDGCLQKHLNTLLPPSQL